MIHLTFDYNHDDFRRFFETPALQKIFRNVLPISKNEERALLRSDHSAQPKALESWVQNGKASKNVGGSRNESTRGKMRPPSEIADDEEGEQTAAARTGASNGKEEKEAAGREPSTPFHFHPSVLVNCDNFLTKQTAKEQNLSTPTFHPSVFVNCDNFLTKQTAKEQIAKAGMSKAERKGDELRARMNAGMEAAQGQARAADRMLQQRFIITGLGGADYVNRTSASSTPTATGGSDAPFAADSKVEEQEVFDLNGIQERAFKQYGFSIGLGQVLREGSRNTVSLREYYEDKQAGAGARTTTTHMIAFDGKSWLENVQQQLKTFLQEIYICKASGEAQKAWTIWQDLVSVEPKESDKLALGDGWRVLRKQVRECFGDICSSSTSSEGTEPSIKIAHNGAASSRTDKIDDRADHPPPRPASPSKSELEDESLALFADMMRRAEGARAKNADKQEESLTPTGLSPMLSSRRTPGDADQDRSSAKIEIGRGADGGRSIIDFRPALFPISVVTVNKNTLSHPQGTKQERKATTTSEQEAFDQRSAAAGARLGATSEALKSVVQYRTTVEATAEGYLSQLAAMFPVQKLKIFQSDFLLQRHTFEHYFLRDFSKHENRAHDFNLRELCRFREDFNTDGAGSSCSSGFRPYINFLLEMKRKHPEKFNYFMRDKFLTTRTSRPSIKTTTSSGAGGGRSKSCSGDGGSPVVDYKDENRSSSSRVLTIYRNEELFRSARQRPQGRKLTENSTPATGSSTSKADAVDTDTETQLLQELLAIENEEQAALVPTKEGPPRVRISQAIVPPSAGASFSAKRSCRGEREHEQHHDHALPDEVEIAPEVDGLHEDEQSTIDRLKLESIFPPRVFDFVAKVIRKVSVVRELDHDHGTTENIKEDLQDHEQLQKIRLVNQKYLVADRSAAIVLSLTIDMTNLVDGSSTARPEQAQLEIGEVYLFKNCTAAMVEVAEPRWTRPRPHSSSLPMKLKPGQAEEQEERKRNSHRISISSAFVPDSYFSYEFLYEDYPGKRGQEQLHGRGRKRTSTTAAAARRTSTAINSSTSSQRPKAPRAVDHDHGKKHSSSLLGEHAFHLSDDDPDSSDLPADVECQVLFSSSSEDDTLTHDLKKVVYPEDHSSKKLDGTNSQDGANEEMLNKSSNKTKKCAASFFYHYEPIFWTEEMLKAVPGSRKESLLKEKKYVKEVVCPTASCYNNMRGRSSGSRGPLSSHRRASTSSVFQLLPKEKRVFVLGKWRDIDKEFGFGFYPGEDATNCIDPLLQKLQVPNLSDQEFRWRKRKVQ
ncbi:unnamed protein product [Amoebophrya sp. A120]|nr:unnamed protein product [Amoebophrya sp. A120]|eukprot:GSA120T00009982001.1